MKSIKLGSEMISTTRILHNKVNTKILRELNIYDIFDIGSIETKLMYNIIMNYILDVNLMPNNTTNVFSCYKSSSSKNCIFVDNNAKYICVDHSLHGELFKNNSSMQLLNYAYFMCYKCNVQLLPIGNYKIEYLHKN